MVTFRFCLSFSKEDTRPLFWRHPGLWVLGFCFSVRGAQSIGSVNSDGDIRSTFGLVVLEAHCCFLARNIPGFAGVFPAPALGSAVCPGNLGSCH